MKIDNEIPLQRLPALVDEGKGMEPSCKKNLLRENLHKGPVRPAMRSPRMLKNLGPLILCSFALCLSLSGCSSPMYWAKPGAQPGDFDRDVVDCRRILAGQQSGGFSASSLNPAIGIPQSAVDQCLGQKGWYLAEKPPDVQPVDPPM